MAKSVCIIGAGPSGLVAAKTLLHNYPKGTFSVTVFEQSERIGGLWPLEQSDAGLVNPQMCTNLSRHTVSFSDLAWPEPTPTFPKAWQVGQYLKRYIAKYGVEVRTSRKVVKAVRTADAKSSAKRWLVDIAPQTSSAEPQHTDRGSGDHATNGSISTHYFDHLIVASGFFGKPKIPEAFKDSETQSFPIIHSSEFRNVKSLLKNIGSPASSPQKILVVGGSMSGVETAASVASQLSSAVNSPSSSGISHVENYSVHHVVKKPFWVMPLFLPARPMIGEEGDKSFNPASHFLPLDLIMYDMASRPPGPLKNKSGRISLEAAQASNKFFQALVGGDQSELVGNGSNSDGIAIQGDILDEAPWLGISDNYAQFVQSGHISTTVGTVKNISLQVDSSSSNSVTISSVDKNRTIENIAAVILATGFENSTSLGFLPDEILKILEYDPKCGPLPLVLSIHSTIHPKIPDLGFVGFYRGPYWGVMEMQARFLGNLWSGDKTAADSLGGDVSTIPDLRKCYYETPNQLQQFPMGDYTYIIESFNSIVNTNRTGESRAGPVLPSRYLSANPDKITIEESTAALSSVGKALNGAANGKFIARAIFTAMQGTWTVTRSLISSISSYPSGTFDGTAQFLPRDPTDNYDFEYLYVEEGDFETENGMKFRATRRYAYRYSDEADTLSVWFVKADNKTVDYLFHEMEILPPQDGSGWRARAHHLCIKDTYDVAYEFRFRGARLQEWKLAYSVKGPNKDYRIESRYWR